MPERAPSADEHPFLTARHVDNLTDAVQTLTRTLVRAEEAQRRRDERQAINDQRQALHDQQQLELLRAIALHTANLPAVIDILTTKANGDLHDADT